MGKFSLAIAFLLAVVPCCSQTPLREQLQDAGIPSGSFNRTELDEVVDGASDSENQDVYFVYVRGTEDGGLTGNPFLVRYDPKSGAVLRSELKIDKDSLCCGSPLGFAFVDEYLLITFHVNPSASSILVLDGKLKPVNVLGGIGFHRVAPGQIVMTENMIHFAPAQPEMLQIVDLHGGTSLELSPLKNDALRNQFLREELKRRPEACKRSPEMCDNEDFDDGCAFLGGDGQSQFAAVCDRSASYQAKEAAKPITYLSDSAIYIFAHNQTGWVYCEQAISEEEENALISEQWRGYEVIKARCDPKLAVIPDASSSAPSSSSEPTSGVK